MNKHNSKNNKRIYLDFATTTPVDSEVKLAMEKYESSNFGNPSSIYMEGVVAKNELDLSRKKIAFELGVKSNHVLFTSGGTESNNMAILGYARSLEKNGVSLRNVHMITSVIEHSSILNCYKYLESLGVTVDYVGVSEKGLVSVDEVKNKIRPNTEFISIMYANNEIGTIQPIRKISNLLKESFANKKIVFHTDASQAPLYLNVKCESLGVDMMTIDSHKIYGPKGIGALYVGQGVKIEPVNFGGHQEFGLRPGTENVSSIVGFAKAVELSGKRRKSDSKKVSSLRDYLIKKIMGSKEKIKGDVFLNGDSVLRLPNNINISLTEYDTEFLTLRLDSKGIAVSTKSACMEGSDKSYVVDALYRKDVDSKKAKTTLRISLGRNSSKKEVDLFYNTLLSFL